MILNTHRSSGLIPLIMMVGLGLVACEPDEEQSVATFAHQPHVEFGMNCNVCHEVQAEKISMPTFNTCLMCHEQSNEQIYGRCNECHQQYDVQMDEEDVSYHGDLFAKYLPGRFQDVKYDHNEFSLEADADCMQCHSNIETSNSSSVQNLPSMETAMAFHEEKGFSNKCQVCHEELNQNTAPQSHNSNWTVQHGKHMEFQDKSSCLMCHKETTCQSCHNTQKPRSHTNLFRRQTHGMEAAFNRDSCMTCHRNDECVSCHQSTADQVPAASYHTPDASCLTCHSPAAAQGPEPRPSRRLLEPMPHRMMMGVTSSRCLQCHMF